MLSWYSTYRVLHLLKAYPLYGCHTVAQCWVIGKVHVVKVQKTGHTSPTFVLYQRHRLRLFRRQLHSWEHVVDTTSPRMTAEACASERVERFKWQSEYPPPPKLQSLPQQINPIGSMRNDPNNYFKRAFGDTQIPS